MIEKQKMISVSTESYTMEQLLQVDKELFGFADFMHCDVMDGVFVERELFALKDLQHYAQNAKMPLDIHLMTENLSQEYKKYIALKPKILTVHYEAFQYEMELVLLLNYFKNHGIKAGVSIKPETSIEKIKKILPIADVILVMSVEIGYGGQPFMQSALEKVKLLKKLKQENNHRYLIEVDGGINDTNAKEIFDAGADILVSGSYISKQADKASAVLQLKKD